MLLYLRKRLGASKTPALASGPQVPIFGNKAMTARRQNDETAH